MVNAENYLQILREELIPALGCTEPIALAYAAARCRAVLGEVAEEIGAYCSANIIKNVKGVVVPNCGGKKGIDTAVVAGMLYGDENAGLEVLEGISEEEVPGISRYISTHHIDIRLLDTAAKLHFIIEMKGKSGSALVEVIHQHTNIVRIEKDGKKILDIPHDEEEINENLSDRSGMSVASIVEFAETVELERLVPILKSQIECNSAICEEGLKNKWGAQVGKTILAGISGVSNRDIVSVAVASAAAGSDARMSGCSLPVVINSGSGNQGITVSVPVIVSAREHGYSEEKLYRGLAISNLLAIHQKTKIGRLSAYCGVVCAACGSGAAITWMEGGSISQIEETIVNTLATISGMICDGAKPSCAGKIAVAVNAAFIAHEMAMYNRSYSAGDGIVKKDIEETVSGVGVIASDGMKDTDKVILDVMLDK